MENLSATPMVMVIFGKIFLTTPRNRPLGAYHLGGYIFSCSLKTFVGVGVISIGRVVGSLPQYLPRTYEKLHCKENHIGQIDGEILQRNLNIKKTWTSSFSITVIFQCLRRLAAVLIYIIVLFQHMRRMAAVSTCYQVYWPQNLCQLISGKLEIFDILVNRPSYLNFQDLIREMIGL